jgi:hypothetical protein
MLLQKFPNRAEYLHKDLQHQNWWVQNLDLRMGMAPTYATLVLGYLEHILYEQLLNSYEQEFSSYVRQNWKRFLHDCFITSKLMSSEFGFTVVGKWFKNSRSSLIKLCTSQHSGLSIMSINLRYSCSWIPWTYFIRTTFE